MSRTDKWEHKTDSYHDNHRMERKARAAGRLRAVVEHELAADGSDASITLPACTCEEEVTDPQERKSLT